MQRTFEIEELLREAGWVRSLAVSLVGDPALADDLVQDTWLAALRHPPAAGSPARPWLARVVHNLARNTRRGRLRREDREERAHEEPLAASPAVMAEAAEAQRLLAEAVTRLGEDSRAVIVLRYFQGLDSRAAAERLGVASSTVRTRLQVALEELRSDLDRRTPGGRSAWAGLLVGVARNGAGVPAAAAAGGSVLAGSWPLALLAAAGLVGVTIVLAAVLTREVEPSVGLVGTKSATVTSTAPPSGSPPARMAEVEAARENVAPQAGAPLDSASISASGTPSNTASRDKRVAGTIRVDGRPPEWPLVVALEMTPPPAPTDPNAMLPRMPRPELKLAPEQHGAFAFEHLPESWSGRLLVQGYAFANGEKALELPEPRTDLLVDLRSGPVIVGRLIDPLGAPCAGLEARLEFQLGKKDEEASEIQTSNFVCRDDGRFRIPSKEWQGWGDLTLRVEAPDLGFLHFESAPFLPAAGLDLGDLQLEPLAPVAFLVRDPFGKPIANATARVDGADWSGALYATDGEGRGELPIVPARPVNLRFAAEHYVDRVVSVNGDRALEVELEPLSMLAIRFSGPGLQGANALFVSSERAAFVWDELGWPDQRSKRMRSATEPPFLRSSPTPEAVHPHYEYGYALRYVQELTLDGLVPDVPLTLEVRDSDEHVLAVATISVAAQEWAVLEIQVP